MCTYVTLIGVGEGMKGEGDVLAGGGKIGSEDYQDTLFNCVSKIHLKTF